MSRETERGRESAAQHQILSLHDSASFSKSQAAARRVEVEGRQIRRRVVVGSLAFCPPALLEVWS